MLVVKFVYKYGQRLRAATSRNVVVQDTEFRRHI